MDLAAVVVYACFVFAVPICVCRSVLFVKSERWHIYFRDREAAVEAAAVAAWKLATWCNAFELSAHFLYLLVFGVLASAGVGGASYWAFSAGVLFCKAFAATAFDSTPDGQPLLPPMTSTLLAQMQYESTLGLLFCIGFGAVAFAYYGLLDLGGLPSGLAWCGGMIIAERRTAGRAWAALVESLRAHRMPK